MRGNITRRGKSSWRIKFDVEPIGGARQIRYVTIKGTRKDAEAELARLLNDAHKGTLVDPTKITLADWLRQWLHGRGGRSLERHGGELPRQDRAADHSGAWQDRVAEAQACRCAPMVCGHADERLAVGAVSDIQL